MPLITIIQNIGYSFLGVLGITFLIGFHELGHFLFCKLFGIDTPSFSIGFGPRILSKKIKGTVFALSAIPLGGYVEIAGNEEIGQGEQKDAHRTDKRSFVAKRYYQKLLVVLGGIIFNLAFAYIALIGLLALPGEKPILLHSFLIEPVIARVIPDSVADSAGFMPGDILLEINDIDTIKSPHAIIPYIQNNPHKNTRFLIERNGATSTIETTIGTRSDAESAIGSLGFELKKPVFDNLTLMQAIGQGIAATNQLIARTAQGIFQLFTYPSNVFSSLSGPVAIIALTTKSAAIGFATFILFLAIISVNLAVLNLLPVPMLDGSQIFLITLETVVGKLSERSRQVIEFIQMATIVLLVALALYLTWQDINRIACL